jgi:peptidoglycan/xylan/chitin deacetylase (PgdA/CDA1 family)
MTDEVGSSICAVDLRDDARHVVLTYDDGPQPGGTEHILSALAAHGATATFFVLLTRVRRHPALFADVVAAGHEIGLHGVDHRRLTTLAPESLASRTTDARDELQNTLGRPVTWFRPPYGDQSPASWHAVTDAGMTPVMWTATLRDWLDTSTEERLTSATTTPGTILLAHDGYATLADGVDDGPAPSFDRGRLATLLLERYTSQGLTGTSLGQALEAGTAVKRVWWTSS